ncbi:transcription termination/antitermination protein NusG [Bradyrhizobium elkanii]|uniref:transcription termination/antitermination protein NusG n=1 Tax=Bradyrhizobium elkanii TaxID=29448 RepID=UPI000841523C|nr:transcription termination/antitermination NusG family protein [Bradyrhizobium elkanii]ODM77780.1 hypothetical protein A6452_34455 [Bradyrhizobium elkanii]ODM81764.1 hypothetical protein A6X20_19060 [Bradyrhizobium elkanii]
MNMQYVKGQFVGYVPIDAEQAAVSIEPQRWYVLKIFPNKESKVMRTFHQRGISAYFPTAQSTVVSEVKRFGHVVGRIKRTVVAPMFAGIIFIPDFQARIGGVMVDGVDGYLKMDQCYPYLTPQLYAQVREIERYRNMPVARKRRLLQQGQAIWVTDGPFASFRGQFDRLDSEGRLKVLIDLFGRMTPVTLDEGQIEPA